MSLLTKDRRRTDYRLYYLSTTSLPHNSLFFFQTLHFLVACFSILVFVFSLCLCFEFILLKTLYNRNAHSITGIVCFYKAEHFSIYNHVNLFLVCLQLLVKHTSLFAVVSFVILVFVVLATEDLTSALNWKWRRGKPGFQYGSHMSWLRLKLICLYNERRRTASIHRHESLIERTTTKERNAINGVAGIILSIYFLLEK